MDKIIDFKKDAILKTILPFIKNKSILDVGCIEHDIKRRNKKRIWVHDFIKKYSSNLTGIDILKDDIKILKGKKLFLNDTTKF